MQIKRIVAFYYSPTRTTARIIRKIATGTGIDPLKIIENDLTFPEHAQTLIDVEPEDLVIIGAPVYAGQIAIEAHKRLENIRFHGNQVVLVAVYGNRHYDDALIDLREMATRHGLFPVAAAAFIGEHSYSTRDFPIARGRPDEIDLAAATSFGSRVAEKISGLQTVDQTAGLQVPGTFPLPPRRVIPSSYVDTAPNKCIKCGVCESVCPTGAIYFAKGYKTDPQKCTVCCACVKACKRRARIIISEHVPMFREKLATECTERREPELFL